ncbi:hypothetical protein NM688_g6505 [Phlebia brevispora]|uniref:Uncharacterized protein n=1 Tax=Phlebia brevispora TaxID=194682 RepID=A0ACC1SFL5_9APHY|nr:hypothetical protein NM688_g6505 [Phlebia brevispora]
MSSSQDLNDPSKTCIYLPAREDDDDASSDFATSSQDLPNGYELRLEAYRIAWQKCLTRVQDIVHALHAPIVATITEDIRSAYSQTSILPGLPYPELPVIAVSAPGGANSVIADVVDALEGADKPAATPSRCKGKGKEVAHDGDMSEHSHGESVVAHVHPGDCPNVMTAMKAIITSFVEKSTDSDTGGKYPEPVKRKASTSLMNYDVNLLRAWYSALIVLRDEPPLLVVFLHDFEKVDPSVMHDVFYIFSQQIPSLHVVFVLVMSTPSPTAYMQSAFQRSCLALLRLRVHTFPSGRATVEEVVQRTFFDPEFQPSIMLGPGVLDFLADFCIRHTPLLDAAISIIQIALLKHFEEPLTILVHDSAVGQVHRGRKHVLQQKESFGFLDSLLTQLWNQDGADDDASESALWKDTSVDNLVQQIDKAREEFHHKAQQMRVAYQAFSCVRRALTSQGIKFGVPNTRDETALEFMSRFVRGRITRDVNHLTLTVKKLSNRQLEAVLSQLYAFFYNLSSSLRRQETQSREFITQIRSNLQGEQDGVDREAASSVGEWLKTYIVDRALRLDEGFLWQIWSTGSTPFPSEASTFICFTSLINALLHPDEVVREYATLSLEDTEEPDQDPRTPEIWELPDTSILFRRYMDAGKMVNVYDWYESFALELDRQRQEDAHNASTSGSGAKGKQKKQKQKQKRKADPEKLSEEEQEKWEIETHARFIRALHELDFMGFIKHTGRKADHVIRTVYDIPD